MVEDHVFVGLPQVAVRDDDGVEASMDDELLGHFLGVGEAHCRDEGGVFCDGPR